MANKTIEEIKAEAAVVRDATEEGENTALRVGTVMIDMIDTLSESVSINAIKGYVVIDSTSELPEEPTPEQQQKGYLLDTTLYVYVGKGGDTLDGKYQSAELKGADGAPGAPGPKGDSGVDLGEVVLVDDLTTGGRESALSAEQGKIVGGILIDAHGVVSPNTAIGSQTANAAFTNVMCNKLTTNDWVDGINIVVRANAHLTISVYNVAIKSVIKDLVSDDYTTGTHTINFPVPVKLGEDEYIGVKPSVAALKNKTSGGVGLYLDGTFYANYEVSFEIKTVKKALQTKVSDLETTTASVPTLKDDVLGTSGKYVSPKTSITTATNRYNNTGYVANRLFTDRQVLGIRVYCTRAGSIDVGLYDYYVNSTTAIKTSLSMVMGLNIILFDVPILLKPSEFIAVNSNSTSDCCVGLFPNTSNDVGIFAGNYIAGGALAYELIVKDDGLVGDVADLQKIKTYKSWCSLGTSITYYNNQISSSTNRYTKGYQSRVMDKIDFTTLYNLGVAGQTAVGRAQNVSGITSVADFYTIEFGINDWHNNVAVGTLNDFINNTGYNTFYGAFRVIIDKIYTLNANAQIILITPRKAYGMSVFPDNWWEDIDGVYLKDYVTAIKEIGEFMSFPICDWFGESNTNQNNLASNSVDVALHPNDVGYQKMANLLVQTFKKVID